MGKLVGICVTLFVLAVGFVFLTEGAEIVSLFNAFGAEPLVDKIAWAAIVLVPIVMLPAAVWLCDTLVRQRKATKALELRLEGVRQRVKELSKTQVGVEGSVHHLTRSDPEDAIAALQRRITEAERFVEVQQNRNEMVDLESRIGVIREQQQLLKERLVPVLDARRSIEQRFAELDSRQSDIERALAEIASGDDAVALEIRLKNLMEFVRQSHIRCDQIEQASKTTAMLRDGYAELDARLAPFAAADGGINSRIGALSEEHERLAANIESLQHMPDGTLADRVQKLADDKKKFDADISQLSAQFSQLATLRKDVAGLFVAFDRTLNLLSTGDGGDGAAGVDGRVAETRRFIEQTQAQFGDIEGRVVVLGQLKTKLGELQSRLGPLQSEEGGVAKLVEDLHDIRERLAAKIKLIDAGEEGGLAARVKTFTEAKKDLEARVATLTDQFSKLATIRRDIAGLFEKLSDAVSASSN